MKSSLVLFFVMLFLVSCSPAIHQTSTFQKEMVAERKVRVLVLGYSQDEVNKGELAVKSASKKFSEILPVGISFSVTKKIIIPQETIEEAERSISKAQSEKGEVFNTTQQSLTNMWLCCYNEKVIRGKDFDVAVIFEIRPVIKFLQVALSGIVPHQKAAIDGVVSSYITTSSYDPDDLVHEFGHVFMLEKEHASTLGSSTMSAVKLTLFFGIPLPSFGEDNFSQEEIEMIAKNKWRSFREEHASPHKRSKELIHNIKVVERRD